MPSIPASSISPELRWLFLDLNSYFASVEQQLRPELRNRPIAVVPLMSDSTCAIAASSQAKKFGVKTGTIIGEAKRMCPGLVLVEARHEKYVEFHKSICDEIERHYPIQVVASIDEVGLLLDKKRANEKEALALAQRIKKGLLANIGEVITCSIGIAPGRYLAKVASDLKKPNGLEVIHLADMPGRLLHLSLSDLPGIGRKMEPRLHEAKIETFQQLWDAPAEVLHRVWGGVGGDRFWHQLHGGDLDDLPTERSTVGHSHVLAPEFRKPSEAVIVARRLLLKAASRLRRLEYQTTEMTVSVRTEQRQRGEGHMRFQAVSDSFALIKILEILWARALQEVGGQRIKKIAVTLHGLEALSAPQQLDLFPSLGCPISADKDRRDKLSVIMDLMNQEFGRDSIALGFAPDSVKTFSGTKIAFTRIPDMEEFRE